MIIKKGELLIISSGEYSDYRMVALCRASQDIDIEALREEYLTLHPEQRQRYRFREYQFVKWCLVDRTVATEELYREWWIDSYSGECDLQNGSDSYAYNKIWGGTEVT